MRSASRWPPQLRPRCPCAAFALLLLAGVASSAWAQQPASQGGGIVLGESCVTAECHSKLKAAKHVHGPVALGNCTECHGFREEGKHEFQPVAKGADLCFECHDEMPDGKSIHGPIRTGECQACHDPHASEHPFMLVADPGRELCFECHDEDDFIGMEHVHGPLVAGECLSCHEHHTSEHVKLLVEEGKDLCFSCHSEAEERFEEHENWHQPVKLGCIVCHDPHTSDQPKQLKNPVPELCWSCHAAVKEQIEESSIVHEAVRTEAACRNCHDPHSSDGSALLTKGLLETCLGCHDRKYERPGRPAIRNIKALLDAGNNKHGPNAEGNCGACHRPHAGDNYRLLVDPFPEGFYAPFDPERYELCFGCHDEELATEESGDVTGFRDAEKNLHFVHVNREVKGRTCRACHAVHASNQPFHIRASAPFGRWLLPIKYEKLDDGGACSPGCHEHKEYHRGDGRGD